MNSPEQQQKIKKRHFVICQCGKQGWDTIRYCRSCRKPGSIGIKWKNFEAWSASNKEQKIYIEAIDENTARKMALDSKFFISRNVKFVGIKKIHISHREPPWQRPTVTLTDEDLQRFADWFRQEEKKMRDDIDCEGEDRVFKYSKKLKKSFADALEGTLARVHMTQQRREEIL